MLLSTLLLGAAVWYWWITGQMGERTGLEIRTVPRGAEITVDGDPVGRSDLTLEDLQPGRVEVVARLTGYRETRLQIRIEEGEVGLAALNLEPLPGTLILEVQGPEEYLVASAEETWETPRKLRLDPGEHRLRIQAPGYREVSIRTRVQAGGQSTLEIAMEKAPLPSLPVEVTPPRPSAPRMPAAGLSLPQAPNLPQVPALPQVRLPVPTRTSTPTRASTPPPPRPNPPIPAPVLTPVPPPPPAPILTPVPPPRTVPETVPQPLLTPVDR